MPALDVHADRLRLASDNFLGIDAYRYDTLDYFFGMAEQVILPFLDGEGESGA